MEWDLQEEAVEAREVGLKVVVGAEWAALPLVRVGSAFVPAAGKGRLISQGFPVRACNAPNVAAR